MKWEKLGSWLPEIEGMTYASMPTWFEGDVYFSPRDRRNRSHIYKSSFNLNTLKLGKPELVAEPGKPEEFDDYGVMVSHLRRDGPRVLMYVVGWNIGVSVPFRNSIGLIINGEKTIGPILDRSRYDPIGVGACWTLQWYVSILGWKKVGMKMQPVYHIVNGHPHSHAITFKDSTEYAIARPCVLNNSEMFYCYRGGEYRIGYATSKDGLMWTRRDEEVGLELGQPGDFDSDALAYPCVFDDGKRYMFYNGNNYGETGFGLAAYA